MMNNHPGFGPAGMTGFPMMQQPGMMGPQGPMMQQQMMMANRGPMMQGNMFPMQVCICINGFDSLKNNVRTLLVHNFEPFKFLYIIFFSKEICIHCLNVVGLNVWFIIFFSNGYQKYLRVRVKTSYLLHIDVIACSCK